MSRKKNRSKRLRQKEQTHTNLSSVSSNRNGTGARERMVRVLPQKEEQAPEAIVQQHSLPFLNGIAVDVAHNRLLSNYCPICNNGLQIKPDSDEENDYCLNCDHLWTEDEERQMSKAHQIIRESA